MRRLPNQLALASRHGLRKRRQEHADRDPHYAAIDRILIDKGPKRISPFLLPSIIGNTAGSMVAIELGAKAVNYGVVLHARHAAS